MGEERKKKGDEPHRIENGRDTLARELRSPWLCGSSIKVLVIGTNGPYGLPLQWDLGSIFSGVGSF